MMKSVSYIYDKTAVLLLKQFARVLAYLVPRRRDLVVLGAWCGDRYADGPKFLAEYLLEKSELNLVWIGKSAVRESLPQHRRLSFAVMGSWSAFWALLRAKTWIFCQTKDADLTTWRLYSGATCINLWHGIPIKGMGRITGGYKTRESRLLDLYARLTGSGEDWTVISNDRMGEIYEQSFPLVFSQKKMLKCGLPRNDFILRNSTNRELIMALKEKYGKMLGFDAHKRVVLYLPTYRMNNPEVVSFYNLSQDDQMVWKSMLDDADAVLIEKHHERTILDAPPPKTAIASVTVMPEMRHSVDVQELLLITDLLICDYSSGYIDYALMRRPCVHFAPDFEAYKKDSGLVYDYNEVVAGPIIKNFKTLFDEVRSQLVCPHVSVGKGFAGLIAYEQGRACQAVFDFIAKD